LEGKEDDGSERNSKQGFPEEEINWEPGGDLDWDICPKLNRRERRAWVKMS
jgi:hypothetical protein